MEAEGGTERVEEDDETEGRINDNMHAGGSRTGRRGEECEGKHWKHTRQTSA